MSHTIEILIVDDRPENLLALESLLEDEDYTLVSSLSGNEALSRTLEHDFALIILDVQMPEMDGFETAELLRGAEKTRFIPIIFVTAISKERHFVFKGYESGAVDYIFKPIEPDILKTKVRFFADYHRQKLELQNKNRQLFETVKNLEHALSEIKRLSGLLPICASCKKIRDDKGYWHQVEVYIKEHSDASFSHSLCPECMKKLYPKLADKISPHDDEESG